MYFQKPEKNLENMKKGSKKPLATLVKNSINIYSLTYVRLYNTEKKAFTK